METNGERWFEVEANRIAGEITLMSPEPDPAKAEAYFDRALAVARRQQAKSWELRAAMSMARLWRDQGKRDEARELLAPVYGWFTEGLDTLDLKEAKALPGTRRINAIRASGMRLASFSLRSTAGSPRGETLGSPLGRPLPETGIPASQARRRKGRQVFHHITHEHQRLQSSPAWESTLPI